MLKVKTILYSVFVALVLVGCSSTPIVKTQIVTVDKPIAIIPKPPVVPKCDFLVDTLVTLDVGDPGKIGQYYKHDMLCLRKTNQLYQLILDQYNQSSQNFDTINEQINKLVNQIKGFPPN